MDNENTSALSQKLDNIIELYQSLNKELSQLRENILDKQKNAGLEKSRKIIENQI